MQLQFSQMENVALKLICVFKSCFGIKYVHEHEYLIWARTAAHPAGEENFISQAQKTSHTVYYKHYFMTKCVCDNGLLDVNVTLIGFVITVLLSFREYFLYAAEFTNYT